MRVTNDIPLGCSFLSCIPLTGWHCDASCNNLTCKHYRDDANWVRTRHGTLIQAHQTDPATGEPVALNGLGGGFVASSVVVQTSDGSPKILQGAEFHSGASGTVHFPLWQPMQAPLATEWPSYCIHSPLGFDQVSVLF
jgi:hypothetical protein